MAIRNLAPRTRECYVERVAQFARYHGRCPSKLEADDEALDAWVVDHLGVRIPHRACCPEHAPRRSARCSAPGTCPTRCARWRWLSECGFLTVPIAPR
jgi:hypothetical protein